MLRIVRFPHKGVGFFRDARILVLLLVLSGSPLLGQPIASFTASKTSGCSPLIVTFANNSTGSPISFFWDFGNGNTSVLATPGVSYTTPGKYTVKLTVTDASGANNTQIRNDYIKVFKNPAAAFTANSKIGCAPFSVAFKDSTIVGDGPINSWLWDFGDGSTSTSSNPNHTFASGGQFKITLIVEDANGCRNSKSINNYITVYDIKPGFTTSGSTGCLAPFTVNFTDTTRGAGSYTYSWDFGDGGTSTARNPSHIYAAGGTYSVKLTVSNSFGCSGTVTRSNLINISPLLASFSVNAQTGCVPSTIQFTDKTAPLGGVFTYLWSFGDGSTSILPNPTYTYITPGVYRPKLTVSASGGCTDTVTLPTSIVIGPALVPVYTISNSVGCDPPDTVMFTDNTPGATFVKWVFGDGDSAIGKSVSHVYQSRGAYTVILTVNAGAACSTRVVLKRGVSIGLAGIKLVNGVTSGCAPLNYTLNYGPDSTSLPLIGYKIRFDNGTTIDSNFAKGVFTNPGVYRLTVTARTNPGNCPISLRDSVTVGTKLIIKFGANKFIGCAKDMTVTFTDSTFTPDPKHTTYFWEFGDGGTSMLKSPAYRYQKIGKFNVKLVVNYNGCKDSLTKIKYITILPPIAKFKVDLNGCANSKIQITDQSLGSDSVIYNFGDGTTDTARNPRHTYAFAGSYKIRQYVYNDTTGCFDTFSTVIRISTPGTIGFTADALMGCDNLTVNFKATASKGRVFTYYVDSNIFITQDLTYTFSKPGIYSVRLIVTDTSGCVQMIDRPNYIKVYGATLNASATATTPCLPALITLRDSSVVVGTISRRVWYFSPRDSLVVRRRDTTIALTRIPQGIDQSTGIKVRYTLRLLEGCTYSREVTLIASDPKILLEVSNSKRCGYDSISLSSRVGDTGAAAPFAVKYYRINGSQRIPISNTLNLTGLNNNYPIRVVITDANGCKDSSQQVVNVRNVPTTPRFNAFPTTATCPPLRVFFRDSSLAGSSPIVGYEWDFGDGSKSSLKNPQKTYLESGDYSVTLTVIDSTGCRTTIVKPALIKIKGPRGSFTFTPNRQCAPMTVTIKANVIGAQKFTYDLGDGNVFPALLQDSIVHTYYVPGKYIPYIIVEDAGGCVVTLFPKDTIEVYGPPDIAFQSLFKTNCLFESVSFSETAVNDTPITSWFWTFGDGGTGFGKQINHTYQDTGYYDVSLTVSNFFGCDTTLLKPRYIHIVDDSIPPSLPIVYRATVVHNDTVLLQFAQSLDTTFRKYDIYRSIAGTQLQLIDSVFDKADTSYYDGTVDASTNSYCYQIQLVDVCGNFSPMSEIHCTIELDVKSATLGIQSDWSSYVGFDSVGTYSVFRTPGLFDSSTSLIGTVPGNVLTYLDSNIDCKILYTYYVEAKEVGGYDQTSQSDRDNSQFLSSRVPKPPTLTRASVEEDKYVLLEWKKAPSYGNFTYFLERSLDTINYTIIAAFDSSKNSYKDENVSVDERSYYYRLVVLDSCGPRSKPSNIARTILVKTSPGVSDLNALSTVIEWNPYERWDLGVEYYNVEFFNPDKNTFEVLGTKNEGDTFIFRHNTDQMNFDNYCYRITAFQRGDTTIVSHSNVDCLPPIPKMFVPNVFSPNKDGKNDVFHVRGAFLIGIELKVYNRWGQRIFTTTDLSEGWDGTYEGVDSPEGVYIYHAIGKVKNGISLLEKGNVTLVR